MSETAFAELVSQVESLPFHQLEELQWKIAMILLEKKRNAKPDISGLKKYFGKVDLDVNLDSKRDRSMI